MTEIKYKDTIIEVEAGKKATLQTKGKMLTENMVVTDDGVSSVQPDLSQNDPNAADYVKGKEEVIFRPDTATVGQTIVVKSVDENGKPTEWEAVDLPEGGGGVAWKLLSDVTLNENQVAQVDVTEDMDGNSLSYENIHIVVFGVGSQATGWTVEIACSTNPSCPDAYQNFGLTGNGLSTTGVWGSMTIEHISDLDWRATAVNFGNGASTPAQVQVYDGLGRSTYASWTAKPDGPIRKLRITPFAGTFSAGFRAIVYGR